MPSFYEVDCLLAEHLESIREAQGLSPEEMLNKIIGRSLSAPQKAKVEPPPTAGAPPAAPTATPPPAGAKPDVAKPAAAVKPAVAPRSTAVSPMQAISNRLLEDPTYRGKFLAQLKAIEGDKFTGLDSSGKPLDASTPFQLSDTKATDQEGVLFVQPGIAKKIDSDLGGVAAADAVTSKDTPESAEDVGLYGVAGKGQYRDEPGQRLRMGLPPSKAVDRILAKEGKQRKMARTGDRISSEDGLNKILMSSQTYRWALKKILKEMGIKDQNGNEFDPDRDPTSMITLSSVKTRRIPDTKEPLPGMLLIPDEQKIIEIGNAVRDLLSADEGSSKITRRASLDDRINALKTDKNTDTQNAAILANDVLDTLRQSEFLGQRWTPDGLVAAVIRNMKASAMPGARDEQAVANALRLLRRLDKAHQYQLFTIEKDPTNPEMQYVWVKPPPKGDKEEAGVPDVTKDPRRATASLRQSGPVRREQAEMTHWLNFYQLVEHYTH